MSLPISFDGATKRYGAATVLDAVSVTLQPGRVHALMGENGAGKSTLIKLIAGVVPANDMTVRKGADVIRLASAADAAAAGFRFIHQELNIVPQLSVAENILLGHRVRPRLGFLVNWPEMRARAAAALDALGIDHIDVGTHAGDLGTGDRMLIKLASALVPDAGAAPPCLYVLDEPTAALKEAEVEKLFRVIRRLRDESAAILYVSHRIEEIEALCDDITVLRNGRLISSGPVAGTSRAEIVRDMTGTDLGVAVPPPLAAPGADVTIRLAGVSTPHLSGLDLDLRGGEVLGVAGLAGAGQTEFLRLFLGLEPVRAGQAQLGGRPIPASPPDAWARGVAYVPQERRSEGLMMQMGARSNALLPHLDGLFARMGRERRQTAELASRVRLKAEGPEQSVWQLSGGNQQKVVFARALAGRPRLLLLDEPTRGVDIGARQELYGLIRGLTAEGCAVIVASGDLPELIGLSDRIVILHEGRQTDVIGTEGLTPEALLNRIYKHQESLSA